MCGPSKAMKSAAAQTQTTANLLTDSFKKIFGDNTNILSSITDALKPVVKDGPSQYGFSKGEDAALRTRAVDSNAAAGQQTTNAVRSAMASRGGGNTYIPSGSEAVIEGSLAQTQAQKQADDQLGITEKGYETGRENFFKSVGDLTVAPGALEAPINAAGTTSLEGQQVAYKSAAEIQKAKNAWIAPVAGLVGTVLGGPIGGAIGSKIGGAAAGGGGSSDGAWLQGGS